MTASAPVFLHDDRAASASKVSLWRDCRLAYAFDYRDKIKTPRGRPAEVGDTVHRALAEAAHLARRLGVARLEPDAAAALVTSTDAGILHEARDLVAGSVHLYDFSNVIGIEHAWSIELGDGLTARGISDLVRFDPEWDELLVDDTKSGYLRPRGKLSDDPQCVLYLCGEREAFVRRTGHTPRRVAFAQVWSRYRARTDSVEWSEELDGRARTLARTALREIEAERDFRPTPGAHCRACDHIERCPTQRDPNHDAALSLSEVAGAAVIARARAKAWGARADELESHLEAVVVIAGPFVAGDVAVTTKDRAGRRLWPAADSLEHALRAAGFNPPPLGHVSGSAFAAWAKTLPKGERGAVWALADRVGPRGLPSRRLVIGGELEDEQEDDA